MPDAEKRWWKQKSLDFKRHPSFPRMRQLDIDIKKFSSHVPEFLRAHRERWCLLNKILKEIGADDRNDV